MHPLFCEHHQKGGILSGRELSQELYPAGGQKVHHGLSVSCLTGADAYRPHVCQSERSLRDFPAARIPHSVLSRGGSCRSGSRGYRSRGRSYRSRSRSYRSGGRVNRSRSRSYRSRSRGYRSRGRGLIDDDAAGVRTCQAGRKSFQKLPDGSG